MASETRGWRLALPVASQTVLLVTGQNPASSELVAKLVLEALG